MSSPKKQPTASATEKLLSGGGADGDRVVRSSARRGAILLEVIFAIVLFASAAAAVIGALNSCMQATGNIRLDAQSADLAVTLLSEIQMGLLPAVSDGPKPFDDPDRLDWTWEIATQQAEMPTTDLTPMVSVEVIITHVSGYTYRLRTIMSQAAQTPNQNVTDTSGTGT